jgi:hypothetical protein
VSDVTVAINNQQKDGKMKTATKVKDLENPKAMQSLYKLSDRLKGFDYVVVSAALTPYVHETYIFGSDRHGEIIDWEQLTGSTRDIYSHEKALNNAGYEVK